MSRSRRVQMAASVVLALFAGCGGGGPAGGSLDQSAPDVAGPLSVASADPIDPIPIDEGSALELAVDWGMEPEEALQILQFRAQFEAVPADMDDTLGDRLVYGGHVAGKPEYVFYVMEIVEGDARWLEEISAAGLGGPVTIEVNPGFPVPSGPCLDRRATVTGSWLEVSATAGGDTVEASYGHGTIGYCPGDDRNDLPGMESDGFYLTIDDAVGRMEHGWIANLFAREDRVALSDLASDADDYISGLNINQG